MSHVPFDPNGEIEESERCEVCNELCVDGEPCACFEEDLLPGEGVPLSAIQPYTREQFYEMLMEDDQYAGLLDPDDFENILIATVISLDKKLQDLLGKVQR